jgi:hypothetical protein
MKLCPYCKKEITNWRCSETCGKPKCKREHRRKYDNDNYSSSSIEDRRIRNKEHYLRSIGVEVKKVKPLEVPIKKQFQPINLQRLYDDRFVEACNQILRG